MASRRKRMAASPSREVRFGNPRGVHHAAPGASGGRSPYDELPQPGGRLGGEAYSGLGERVERERRALRNYRRSDHRLYEDACETLIDQADIDIADVSVHVSDGVVTLDGTVPERWMKHAAEDAVAEVRGVVDVDNRLRRPGPGDMGPDGASHWRKASGL